MKPSSIHISAAALHALVCAALISTGSDFLHRAVSGDIGASVVVTALCGAALAGVRLQLSLILAAAARALSFVGLPGARTMAASALCIAPAVLKTSAASMTAVVFAAGAAHASPAWPTDDAQATAPRPAEPSREPTDPAWPTQPPDEPHSPAEDSRGEQADANRQAPRQSETVTVAAGDSLWTIALRHPDPDMSTADRVEAISTANADVIGSDPDLIYPNTELELP